MTAATAAELEAQGFRPLDETSLVAYIRTTPALAASLGGRVDALEVKEVGDGNLNFVYIVLSDGGSSSSSRSVRPPTHHSTAL
jgi:5-methylthioribose kinase